jgi:hypothetical protein
MLHALLALLWLSPAWAQYYDAGACWSSAPGYYWARIENPAKNLAILAVPQRFAEVCDKGVVVANGTFFAPHFPLGDVIIDGRIVFSPEGALRRFRSGKRSIDLGARWGVGVLKGSRTLAVADGDSALTTMETFLGGGGLLLEGGVDVTAKNLPDPERYGPAFPDYILARKAARTALGFKTENGAQVLLVLGVLSAPGATIQELARIMKGLGAEQAVFYDGGGAAGFAAGGRCLENPSNAGEDLNPTHIVIKACR